MQLFLPILQTLGGKPVGDLHRSFCCARLPEYCGLFSALKPVVEDGIDCR